MITPLKGRKLTKLRVHKFNCCLGSLHQGLCGWFNHITTGSSADPTLEGFLVVPCTAYIVGVYSTAVYDQRLRGKCGGWRRVRH